MKGIIEDIKKAVVFFGYIINQKKDTGVALRDVRFIGTGFLINKDGICHLVTAKHVVNHDGQDKLCVFFNADQGIKYNNIKQIKDRFACEFIYHKNEQVDLAVMPFPINEKTDFVKVVPPTLFSNDQEIYEMLDVIYCSFQQGINIDTKIKPIMRSGLFEQEDFKKQAKKCLEVDKNDSK